MTETPVARWTAFLAAQLEAQPRVEADGELCEVVARLLRRECAGDELTEALCEIEMGLGSAAAAAAATAAAAAAADEDDGNESTAGHCHGARALMLAKALALEPELSSQALVAFASNVLPGLDAEDKLVGAAVENVVASFATASAQVQAAGLDGLVGLLQGPEPHVQVVGLLARCVVAVSNEDGVGDAVRAVKQWCLDTLARGTSSETLSVEQFALDQLLPALCQRHAAAFDGAEFEGVLAALPAKAQVVRSALLVGLFASCMHDENLQRKLLARVASTDAFWETLKRDLISRDFRTEKRAAFLLKAALTMLGSEDSRWDALCDLLESLTLMEVHHTKDNWGRMELLMLRNEERTPAVPHLGMDWVALVFQKAFAHTNPSVRKVAIKNFLKDWPRYVADQRFMRVTPRFLFDTFLPGMNHKDMYRVIVQDDLTGETGSMFHIEDDFPGIFASWFEDHCSGGDAQVARTTLCDFVRSISGIPYGSNIALSMTVVRALRMAQVPEGRRWLGEAEVQHLLELARVVEIMADSPELLRLTHATFHELVSVLCIHGDAEGITMPSLTRLLGRIRARTWPAELLRISEWLRSSEAWRARACALASDFLGETQDSGEPVAAEVVALGCVLLAHDRPALERSVEPLREVLTGLFARPYGAARSKRRACLLLGEVLAWLEWWPAISEPLCGALLRGDVLEQVALWARQLLAPGTLGARHLLERHHADAFSPESFLVSNCDDAESAADANYAVEVLGAVARAIAAEDAGLTEAAKDVSELVADLGPRFVAAIAAPDARVDTICQALAVLAAIAPAWARVDGADAERVQAINALASLDLRVLANDCPADLSKRSVWGACEKLRWAALRALFTTKRAADPLPRLSDAQRVALVGCCLEGFDVCNDALLATVFDVLRCALAEPCAAVDMSEIWRSCLAAHNSGEKQSQRLALALVRTVFQTWMFDDPVVVRDVLKPAWQHILERDNSQCFGRLALAKHCVVGVLGTSVDRLLAFSEELLEMLRFSASLSTHETADVKDLELCSTIETPFDKVRGVRVHPHAFVRLAVLDVVDRGVTGDPGLESFANTVLDAIVHHNATRKKLAVHCAEGWLEIHLWSLTCLLVAKLDPGNAPARGKLFDRIVSAFMLSICPHSTRAYVELVLLNLVLSSDPDLALKLIAQAEGVVNERRPVVLSLFIMLGVLGQHVLARLGHVADWHADDRIRVLQRLSVVALPFMSVSDLMVRCIAASIVAPVFAALHSEGHFDSERQGALLKHTSEIVSWKGTGGLLQSELRNYDPREAASFETQLRTPTNAYGEALLRPLCHILTAKVDAYLLERFNTVRTKVTKRQRGPQEFRDIAEREARTMFTAQSGDEQAVQGINRQLKVDPWKEWTNFLTVLHPGAKSTTRKRELFNVKQTTVQHLIVVTSLLDDVASVASLSRTSEIFAASTLVLDNLALLEDPLFESISVSSGNWLPFTEVPRARLLAYLQAQKAQGYRIVGIEQGIEDATNLMDYAVPADGRVVLVCPNQVEGMPAAVLQACDDVVRPPRFGLSRGLLSNIFGAVAIWEYTRQQRFPAAAAPAAAPLTG